MCLSQTKNPMTHDIKINMFIRCKIKHEVNGNIIAELIRSFGEIKNEIDSKLIAEIGTINSNDAGYIKEAQKI